MKERILTAARFFTAAFLGYGVIVLGTTLTLEVLLGGFSYRESSAAELSVATLGGLLSGLAGGYLAAWIGGRRPVRHALGVLIFLVVDTTWVATSGVSRNPVWFNLAAGGGLMAATVLGGFLRRLVLERGPGGRRLRNPDSSAPPSAPA